MKLNKNIRYLLVMVVLLCKCNKPHYLLESPEKKIWGWWVVQNASKNGISFPSDSLCAINTSYVTHGVADIEFGVRGEVMIYCYRLVPNNKMSNVGDYVGTWEFTNNKKEILISVVDTTFYLSYNIMTPITPKYITWHILKITGNELKVQETRNDGIYLFDLINRPRPPS